ncbi:Transmembrane and coiled-coil domain-containing protein 4, partial [Borealophlyctis nickersoniae]
LQGNPSLPLLITIDGFGHSGSTAASWTRLATTAFPSHPWYSFHWEAAPDWILDTLRAAADSFFSSYSSTSPSSVVHRLVSPHIHAPLSAACTAAGKTALIFRDAMESARGAAYLLADCIARLPSSRRVILMGHSLGAYIIFRCLRLLTQSALAASNLGDASPQPKVEMAFLLGGAARADHVGWEAAAESVRHRIVNMYSEQDLVVGMLPGDRCGRAPIKARSGKVTNVECVEVDGHGVWKEKLDADRVIRVMEDARTTYQDPTGKQEQQPGDRLPIKVPGTRKRLPVDSASSPLAGMRSSMLDETLGIDLPFSLEVCGFGRQ